MAGVAPAYTFPKEDLVSLNINPVTLAADGTITVVTSPGFNTSLMGYLASAEITVMQTLSKEMSLDSGLDNYVAIYTGFEMTILEKVRRGSPVALSFAPVITQLIDNYSYAQIVWAVGLSGSTTKLQTWTAYGVWENLPYTMRDQGNVVVGISFKQFDTSYATSGVKPLSYVLT